MIAEGIAWGFAVICLIVHLVTPKTSRPHWISASLTMVGILAAFIIFAIQVIIRLKS
jgi:hypothetical protein